MTERRHVTPAELVGERIGGRFKVEKLIGHGPLSTAFRAYDDRLHRRVTVKLFHPQHEDDQLVVQNQLERARQVARLSHENIGRVIDRLEHEGLPLVVLEYVVGKTLLSVSSGLRRLLLPKLLDTGKALTRALAYAHAESIVHGNIRPENVLLDEDREIKLVDFGGGSFTAQLTGDPFLAPERMTMPENAPMTVEDDIYAVGVLLFVALTEKAPPLGGMAPGELQLLRPDVTVALAESIAIAIAPHPQDRHASMRDFASALAPVEGPRKAAHRYGSLGFDAPRDASGSSDGHAAINAARASETTAFFDPWEDEDTEQEALGTLPIDAAVLQPEGLSGKSAPVSRPQIQQRRARVLAWSMVIGPIAVLILVGVMIAGERQSGTTNSDDAALSAAAAEHFPVAIASATGYDPDGTDTPPGEHDELAGLAIDGEKDLDPKAAWNTEGYSAATMVGRTGKPKGVGLLLTLVEPAELNRMKLYTDLEGWDVQVFGAETRPQTFAGWRELSEKTTAASGQAVPLDTDGEKVGVVLVWTTRLSLDTNDRESFRARIAEVELFGPVAVSG